MVNQEVTVYKKSKANYFLWILKVFVRKKEQFYVYYLLIFSFYLDIEGGLYSGKSECLVSPKNCEFYDITGNKSLWVRTKEWLKPSGNRRWPKNWTQCLKTPKTKINTWFDCVDGFTFFSNFELSSPVQLMMSYK